MAKFYCPTTLSENISETPEGYLLCLGVPIGRTGVMEYGHGETPLEVGEDGIVYVSRDAEELFSAVTMASFEGKSVTIKHPEEFVNPKNWKELTKGTIHNVRKASEKDEDGEDVLMSDLLITESFAISLVKAGLRELSCGYEAEYEQTGPGKGKQTRIVGNHLALVEEGRAGSSYAIRDHKRKVIMGKSLGEKIKAMLGQTIDEAIAEGEKTSKKKTAATVVGAAKDKAKTKAKDESATPTASKSAGSETNVVMDADQKKAFDEMKASYDAMGKMLDAMMKPKAAEDESEEEEESEDESESEGKKKEDESEDEGEDTEILERVKALEAALAKLLEAKDAKEDESEDESESEDEAEEEESEDEAEEEESEDEAEAVKGGEEKKKTGDKAAEVKTSKKTGLEKTKSASFESFDSSKEEMTPEKMNELNSAHWARK